MLPHYFTIIIIIIALNGHQSEFPPLRVFKHDAII